MMKVKLLPIFVITLATVSTISFGMELQTVPAKIIIQCADKNIELDNTERNGTIPGLGDILRTSQTITNMLEDAGKKEDLESGKKLTISTIPFTQMPAKNFECAYEYMKLIANNQDQDINQKLQKSSLSDLCLGLQGCNYLDVKIKNEEKQEVCFVNTKLRPAIACKFNYKNDQDFEIMEKVDLADHKQVTGGRIASRLSLTTICMSQADIDLTDKNQSSIGRNCIFGEPLDVAKKRANTQRPFYDGTILQSNAYLIASASEKGNVFVFGYCHGQVVIGYLKYTQDIPSHSKTQLDDLFFCMKDAAVWGQRDHSMLDGSKVSALRVGWHEQAVESVDLHPTKLLLVTADNQEVKLWNLSTKSCVRTFNKDSDGDFDPATIRFNEDGDKIISGSDDNNPLSSWECHDPYEVVRYLVGKKKNLGDKKSFIDDILKHVPVDSRVSWSQWLLSYKERFLFGGLVLGGLFYYKRGALLSFLRLGGTRAAHYLDSYYPLLSALLPFFQSCYQVYYNF